MVIPIPLAGWFGWGREYREAFGLAISALASLRSDLKTIREAEEKQVRLVGELRGRDRLQQSRLGQAVTCFGHTTCDKGRECAMAIKLVSECLEDGGAGNNGGD